MRAILCVVALCFLGSVAHAERIIVTSASATYFTQSATVEFSVTFADAPDFSSTYFAVGGRLPVGGPAVDEWVSINNSTGKPGEYSDTFTITHVTVDHRGTPSPEDDRLTSELMGTLDYTLNGHALIANVPFSTLGLSSPVFEFETHDDFEPIIGMSSIDKRVVYTPEPSSVALAILGMVLGGSHRLRRRSPRSH